MTFEFKEFPKIPRGQNEEITITEKIDGTNACVVIYSDWEIVDKSSWHAGAQSRNRIITPDSDNQGFAAWVREHEQELIDGLGEGYHYGEWAGPGIQRNKHKLDRKRFFLFNTARWNDDNPNRPECCSVVPVLYEGEYEINDQGQDSCDLAMIDLQEKAKLEGYEPEGIVVWYHKTRRYEKYTFKNPNGKWAG